MFTDAPNLTSINVDNLNPNYSSVSGVLFDKLQQNLLYYPRGITKSSYTIPSTVTKIYANAVYNVTALSSVYFSGTIPAIDFNNFNVANDTAYYYPTTSNADPSKMSGL